MPPDKGQAKGKAEADYISHDWWKKLGENDPEYTRILRKLRSERKALLRRLGGNLTSDEKVVTTCHEMVLRRLAPFFQGNRGRRLRAKLLVAIGKCETLKDFDNLFLIDLPLQPKECEVLLKPMKANYQLERIVWRLDILPAGSSRHIGELVKGAGNLKTFILRGSMGLPELQGIAERFPLELAAIASSLQGHKHGTLATFVAGRVDDLTNDIVKIISSAPHLSHIKLYGPCSMDETTKVVLCAALKECSDLKRVTLENSSERILEVLAKVYGQRFPDLQVWILESLKLKRPLGLAGLACLASSNICNLQIQLCPTIKHSCSLEEWQRVGRSLIRHPTLRVFEIIIEFESEAHEEYTVQLGKELAELWKASRKSPLLDIKVQILPIRADKDVILKFLEDALKDTYLKEIQLEWVGKNPERFKSFAEMVGANTSVRSLRLHEVSLCRMFDERKVHGGQMSPTVLEDCWAHILYYLRPEISVASDENLKLIRILS